MSVQRRFVPLVVIAGVALAACTSAATPVPTTTPTQGASAAASASPVTDGTLPKPELTSVKMGSPIGQFSQFGGVLAEQLGLYEKYGISVTLSKFNAGGDAINALLAGTVDVGADNGAEVGLTTQLSDTPAEFFSAEKIGVYDGFFCNSSIKTAADVKGKTVGISSFGAAGDASARIGVKALGLDPLKDVVLTQIGGSNARLAALKSGAIACGPLDIGTKAQMLALGFNLLVDESTSGQAYPATGIASTVAFAKKYPNTILDLVAAELEATSIMIHDKSTTVQQWAIFLQEDQTKAAADYDGSINQINADLTWPADGVVFAQSVLATVNPQIASVDPTKAYDASVLKKLNDIGFYKKVNIPYPTKSWP